MKIVSYTTFVVFITLAIGCATTQPPANPPAFGRGDVIAVTDSEQVGVIINVYNNNPHWYYKVLFRDRDLDYKEDKIKLIERANWNRKVPMAAKAEVDGKSPINVDPK